jgi:hypothetical protein
VPSATPNPKFTVPADLPFIESLLREHRTSNIEHRTSNVG